MKQETEPLATELLSMTSEIVGSFVANAHISSSQIPDLISLVHKTLHGLTMLPSSPQAAEPEILKAAVPIRRSVTPDYIVCLEDGKKLRMMKRHLRTTYGLSPEEYRARWNLPSDYPMVAPNYAKQRSDFAKKIGLGLKSPRRGRRKAN
jgi:predicted transcriptional regulator